MEYLFQCIEDRKEENGVEDKIYQKFYPAGNTHRLNQHSCERIRKNYCTEYPEKKDPPFFYWRKIHSECWRQDY